MSAALHGVLAKLQDARRDGRGWLARCPAHNDGNPSLHIEEREGRILLTCRSQKCSVPDIVSKLGLKMSDLFDRPVSTPPGTGKPAVSFGEIVAEYLYHNEAAIPT